MVAGVGFISKLLNVLTSSMALSNPSIHWFPVGSQDYGVAFKSYTLAPTLTEGIQNLL